MAAATRTYLAFHHNAKLHKLATAVQAVHPFSALSEANRQLFKQGGDGDYVVITDATIFHPQGGGQPSDTGSMVSTSSSSSSSPAGQGNAFSVSAVRTDADGNSGAVLHFGRFATPSSSSSSSPFSMGETVEQAIDVEKRELYSRLHTAGHVLGAAVRHLLEKEIDGFDELKASHFPDSAGCEFRGAIEGKWKEPIQRKVDEYVAAAMPVEIDWWDEEDFRRNGLERLIPDRSLLPPGDDKFRVVKIVGAEVYPCGGTHVDTTDLCGKTTVRKIQRSKGTSRVAYAVA